MQPFSSLFATLCSSLLLCSLSLPALAGSFSINPVRLDIATGRNATALMVGNTGTEPQLLQVRVYRWTHSANEDVLTEVSGSDAPIVTPPLFRLAPGGGSQVVRIGFQKPTTPLTEERQWRVLIEEVPSPPSGDSASGPEAASGPPLAIALRLRVSVPLFQRPATSQQDLQWTLAGSANQPRLTARNQGNVTERLDDIQLGPASNQGSRLGGPIYIFPGEQRTFALQPAAALPYGPISLNLAGTPRPLVRELVLRAQ